MTTITTLADKQEKVWNRIKDMRKMRTLYGGYMVTLNGVDKWFNSDLIARTQQLGLLLLGPNIPAGLQWKTMDDSFVLMDQALIQQVFAAAATQDSTTFFAAEAHKEAMLLLADPYTYDYSSGWPKIYGE